MDTQLDEMKYLVYCHINNSCGKAYVGITKQTPSNRWASGEGYKRQAFYKVIQEYGWDNFEHKILVEGLNKEEAEYLETFYIDYYDSCNNGYNVDYAEGPINAMCGEYYRNNNIIPDGQELLRLYREKGTIDLEQIEFVRAMLEKYKG